MFVLSPSVTRIKYDPTDVIITDRETPADPAPSSAARMEPRATSTFGLLYFYKDVGPDTGSYARTACAEGYG
jgi:hypothetical protein